MSTHKAKWNQRFRDRSDELNPPEPFLVQNLSFLKPGSILDLACGDGRNALFLAENGFEVTGADFSVEGIKRLNQFATKKGLQIKTTEIDVESAAALRPLGPFDNIIISHFKPLEKTWHLLSQLLIEGGIFIICTFNMKQAKATGFPEKFCLKKDELVGKLDGLDILKHESFENDGKFFDGYVFEKESPKISVQ
jgi:2-polyprenyl-3-methyl-5-hydroxy-6-metoxy-1,4-benzoquinol methylase